MINMKIWNYINWYTLCTLFFRVLIVLLIAPLVIAGVLSVIGLLLFGLENFIWFYQHLGK